MPKVTQVDLAALAQLLPMLQALQSLSGLLNGQGLNAVVQTPKAQSRAPKAQRERKTPEPRVISKDAAVAAGTMLLSAGVPGSAGVFSCTYKNRRGYASLKVFKVIEGWTNAEGHPGVKVNLCDPTGKVLGTDDSVGDGSRKLILGAMSDLKRLV